MATSIPYVSILTSLTNDVLGWDTDDIKFALLSSAHTPDTVGDTSWSDVLANEITGTNYTSGGKTLTSRVYTNSGRFRLLQSDPISFGTLTASNVRYGVVYNNTPIANVDKFLLFLVDFGATYSPTAQNFGFFPSNSSWLSLEA